MRDLRSGWPEDGRLDFPRSVRSAVGYEPLNAYIMGSALAAPNLRNVACRIHVGFYSGCLEAGFIRHEVESSLLKRLSELRRLDFLRSDAGSI